MKLIKLSDRQFVIPSLVESVSVRRSKLGEPTRFGVLISLRTGEGKCFWRDTEAAALEEVARIAALVNEAQSSAPLEDITVMTFNPWDTELYGNRLRREQIDGLKGQLPESDKDKLKSLLEHISKFARDGCGSLELADPGPQITRILQLEGVSVKPGRARSIVAQWEVN